MVIVKVVFFTKNVSTETKTHVDTFFVRELLALERATRVSLKIDRKLPVKVMIERRLESYFAGTPLLFTVLTTHFSEKLVPVGNDARCFTRGIQQFCAHLYEVPFQVWIPSSGNGQFYSYDPRAQQRL